MALRAKAVVAMKTAILFQTHFFDRWAAAAVGRLRKGAPPGAEVIVVMHLPPRTPVPDRVRSISHHIVRTPELRAMPYPVKAGGGTDWHLWGGGHTDLIPLHFWQANPGYEQVWQIEYDVAFSGSWHGFFSAFEDDQSDLLATVIFCRRDFPQWERWETLVVPPGEALPGDTGTLHTFMPIWRASSRMMHAMDAAYRAGWGGHVECTWGTVALARGLSVTDIGGEGEFTSARNRGHFYTTSPFDVNLSPGTMRFYPPLHRVGSRPNMLWHPVKPFWLRVELRRALLASRSAGAAILRRHCPWVLPSRWRTPGSFTTSRVEGG
jgi:hypothetical protein